jgi:hypothetical protein
VALASQFAVPVMYGWREFVVAGGLISYAPSIIRTYIQTAIYVAKILKGANQAELPIEQPTKFELVINLKTPTRSASRYRSRFLSAPTRSSPQFSTGARHAHIKGEAMTVTVHQRPSEATRITRLRPPSWANCAVALSRATARFCWMRTTSRPSLI